MGTRKKILLVLGFALCAAIPSYAARPAPVSNEVHRNHGQCVSSVAHNTPSNPAKGPIVSERAHNRECSGGPQFVKSFDITGDLDILIDETTTLTAEWKFRDDVTMYTWSVSGAGIVDSGDVYGSSGSSTLVFGPADAGTYVITFHIWDYLNSDHDVSGSVTVTVTDPTPVPIF